MAVSINLFSGAFRYEWKNFDFLYPFFMRVFTVCVYPFSYIFVAHFFCPICSTFFIRLHTNTRERRVQTTAVLLVQYLLDRLECALKGTDRANITPTFHTKWTVRYSSLLILLLVFVFFFQYGGTIDALLISADRDGYIPIWQLKWKSIDTRLTGNEICGR